jgi:hypothetical protein
MTCSHEDFEAVVDVARIVETEGGAVRYFSVSTKVRCTSCDVFLRVIDPELPVGLLPGRATTDVLGTELICPMWPADGTDPAIGMMAGFTVRQA